MHIGTLQKTTTTTIPMVGKYFCLQSSLKVGSYDKRTVLWKLVISLDLSWAIFLNIIAGLIYLSWAILLNSMIMYDGEWRF